MQQYADIYLLLNYCTCFGRPSRSSSGVHETVVAIIWSRLKKLAPPDSMICTTGCQLQFHVLLMMGAMDARNMYSNLTVNKYLHTHFNFTN